jgi:uncharacterized membrane protein YjfL (UPF0719 family)
MYIDYLVSGAVYTAAAIVLFVVGRLAFALMWRRVEVAKELVVNDNPAFGLVMSGYYAALFIVVGGVLLGPSGGLYDDVYNLMIYGLLGIFLLVISSITSDKILFSKFSVRKEVLEDRNAGMGFLEAAVYIGSSMVLFGAINGQGGSILTAVVFWLVGQVVFIGLVKYYEFITPYSFSKTIEKDNVASGIAFAGILIAASNLIRIAIQGDFEDWLYHGEVLLYYVIVIAVLLPLLMLIIDKIILPGQKLANEIAEQGNLAAATVNASIFILVSMLISWIY